MGDDRTALDMNIEALDDFAPKSQTTTSAVTRKEIDKVSSFPSRDAPREGQVSIKSPDNRIIERFKAMCKADRRKYYDMLEILMDAYEGKSQKE